MWKKKRIKNLVHICLVKNNLVHREGKVVSSPSTEHVGREKRWGDKMLHAEVEKKKNDKLERKKERRKRKYEERNALMEIQNCL